VFPRLETDIKPAHCPAVRRIRKRHDPRYDRAGIPGLALGSEVRLSGIKIGRVVAEKLDPDTYLAIVQLSIERDVKLPVDTTAKITSDSLLGSNYIAIEPGGDEKLIPDGGQIVATQDPINIGDLIGRYIFGSTGGKPKSKPEQPEQSPPAQTSGGQ